MRDWPHSPVHRLSTAGTFMVTAGTYQKVPFFGAPGLLDLLCDTLFATAAHNSWQLQAWAVFPNHYHFIGISPPNTDSLRKFIRFFHSSTATELNKRDGTPARRVWYEYWESQITFQKAYLARLSYVLHNAVRHGLVRVPSEYPWCSAGWFERKAARAFYRTVMSYPFARVKVQDDYSVEPISPM